jgi:Uma2 family endonuclease
MKPLVPPPPRPFPIHYNPLPDHTQLPDHEGGKPLRAPPGPPPDHTQLPDKDGTFVRNSFESWQSHLLTDSLLAVAERVHPQGDYFIGEDCGIYFRITDPPERGVKAPDWFVVPGVPRLLDGQMRRSYVLWQELISPLIVLEYVSGDGTEERDRTPQIGKFWVYENVVKAGYYGIFSPNAGSLEMYELQGHQLVQLAPNAEERYRISPLGVELAPWRGNYAGFDAVWLRWWDLEGNLVPTGAERAKKADRMAAKLRELGVDLDAI